MAVQVYFPSALIFTEWLTVIWRLPLHYILHIDPILCTHWRMALLREEEEDDESDRGRAEAEGCLFPGWLLTGGRCFSGGSFWPEYTTPDSLLCFQPWPACPLHSISPAQKGYEWNCWRKALDCWAETGHPAPQAGSWGGFHPKTASAGYRMERTKHVTLSFLLLQRLATLSACVHLKLQSFIVYWVPSYIKQVHRLKTGHI